MFFSSSYYCCCYREKQLNGLMQIYINHENEMCDALMADLKKSRQESILNEVELLRNDLRNTIMNFKDWAQSEKVISVWHSFNRKSKTIQSIRKKTQ